MIKIKLKVYKFQFKSNIYIKRANKWVKAYIRSFKVPIDQLYKDCDKVFIINQVLKLFFQ